MKPISLVLLAGLLCTTGCTQSLFNHTATETRVIEQFSDALEEQNEPALRRIASTRFESRALSSEDVLHDLRVMKLPTGDLSVVDVKDVGKGRREVVVKEESGGKYQFHLVNDPEKKYWTVDDVVVRQRSKGSQVTKSTAEVMELLMTLREFLGVWETGSRDEIMAMTSSDLNASLSPLPDAWLTALTSRIASTYEDGMSRNPKANLHESEAVVKLPARNGHLLIRIVREDDAWLVDDVESHNHRDDSHPGSVRRQADAINTVNAFLTAYSTEDYDVLQQIVVPKLYEGSLKLADLSLIQLPQPDDVTAEFDIRAYEQQLAFLLPSGRDIVRLDLKERDSESPATTDEFASQFVVRDVTLYDKATQKQRTLSSVFTAPTRAALFLRALSQRNHQMLTQLSTTTFARGTWQRLSPEMLAKLAVPDFDSENLRLTDSHSIADSTELEFETGQGKVVACRLLSQNGILKVDDVQYPNEHGQVTSLRSGLSLAAPLLEFSTAWSSNNMELLQKSCSSDFNRLVWSHLQQVPDRFTDVPATLIRRPDDTHITQERASVRFRSDVRDLIASLVVEHGFWVVDDIRIESGAGNAITIREQLRGQIADQLLNRSYSTVISDDGYEIIKPVHEQTTDAEITFDQVVPVSASAASAAPTAAVSHAHFEVDSDAPPQLQPAVHADDMVMFGKEAAMPQKEKSMAGAATVPHQTADDMLVFGPQAADAGARLSAPAAVPPVAGPATSLLDQAIDMTPGVPAATTPAADDVLMFGPASEKKSMPPQPAAAKRVRQPADAPISVW